MSSIKEEENAARVVLDNDLIMLVNNAGITADSVTPRQIAAGIIRTGTMSTGGVATSIPNGSVWTKLGFYDGDDEIGTVVNDPTFDSLTVPLLSTGYTHVKLLAAITVPTGNDGAFASLRARDSGTLAAITNQASSGSIENLQLASNWLRIVSAAPTKPYEILEGSAVELQARHDATTSLSFGNSTANFYTMECR